ncbi:protein of unknown function DUF450 [Gloeothece citriformis PCC 7424]|uniref:Type I restriction enzyme R protein N-terminal domain-containing protein n=1 Tax=Gloeothece citriformis (strain PCC 7424) TaxID=65393 RepID=B7KIV3_GLOC7|nr:type I restriction enzyme HsdR N-terminal domain-containing protein [Gloeothece citriformis]ACK70789.1 protein of unknown function DUF450 [Gloeothece citriformis PCC 7424]
MTQTVGITEAITSFNKIEELLNLNRNTDEEFFREWFENLPHIIDSDKQILNSLKDRYFYYANDNAVTEGTINIIMISPLLELVKFCDPPFKIRAEKAVKIELEDREISLQGFIDALVVQNLFWIVVIEAKRYGFNVSIAVPQALAYMMANPNQAKPVYGMVTNGEDYIFIKLDQQSRQYNFSDKLTLSKRSNTDFYQVLQIMKAIKTIVSESESIT